MDGSPTSFSERSPFDEKHTSAGPADSTDDLIVEPGSLSFLDLPGEVRNRIYEYVNINATTSSDQQNLDDGQVPGRLRVSVKPGYMYYCGIKPIPLLFANRQVYEELSSVIYSNMGTIRLRVYRFEHRNKLPTYRCTYESLNRWPNIRTYARHLKIIIVPQDHVQKQNPPWKLVSYKHQSDHVRWEWGKPFESQSLLKSLAKYLEGFESLENLRVLVKSNQKPAGLDDFISLYRLLDGRTTFQFHTMAAHDKINEAWTRAWEARLERLLMK